MTLFAGSVGRHRQGSVIGWLGCPVHLIGNVADQQFLRTSPDDRPLPDMAVTPNLFLAGGTALCYCSSAPPEAGRASSI
jgi:hypothetical protein